ncbi:hypothetical protein LCGC14_2031740 [marine sediment metagenome]|uniref:Tyr recombinase domain-containing protein n=1 Tax=marine sediment metagenome TaxID=412755 RepID=A0A0F9HRJ9_9ZZZZ
MAGAYWLGRDGGEGSQRVEGRPAGAMQGAAGVAYEVGGKQADRKCLRKTFCTHLALAGVDLWHAVKLMRHRDPRLTLSVYADLGLLNTGEALGKLAVRSREVSIGRTG